LTPASRKAYTQPLYLETLIREEKS
jgi:hypothetical protein